MGHPTVDNKTPFAFEMNFTSDEEGQPICVPIVKATYKISSLSTLELSSKQIPVNLVGETWGEPGISSYKYEPEGVFFKPATDVVLIGHAYAQYANQTEGFVRLKLGPLEKTVRIVGDRFYVKRWGLKGKTRPAPYEKIPLLYERAFGGWDRSHPNPEKHRFEARNPVGTGFRSRRGEFINGLQLPNIEDVKRPLSWFRKNPPPAGFGFTSPNWAPRTKLAGTYDKAWEKNRMPLLPKDFDRRFFNSASEGLIAPGYLKGNESVLIENVSPEGQYQFNLPAGSNPICEIQLRQEEKIVSTNLDTIILNTDEKVVLLIWRNYLPIRQGPHDVVSVRILSGA